MIEAIINVDSGQVELTEVNPQVQEDLINKWNQREQALINKIEADKQKELSKTILLNRLGITEEEAKLLLS